MKMDTLPTSASEQHLPKSHFKYFPKVSWNKEQEDMS